MPRGITFRRESHNSSQYSSTASNGGGDQWIGVWYLTRLPWRRFVRSGLCILMFLGVGDAGDAGGKSTSTATGGIIFFYVGWGIGVEGSSGLMRGVTVLLALLSKLSRLVDNVPERAGGGRVEI